MGLVCFLVIPILGRQRQEDALRLVGYPANFLSLLGEFQASKALCRTWGVTTEVEASLHLHSYIHICIIWQKNSEIRALQSEVVTHSLLTNNSFRP